VWEGGRGASVFPVGALVVHNIHSHMALVSKKAVVVAVDRRDRTYQCACQPATPSCGCSILGMERDHHLVRRISFNAVSGHTDNIPGT